MYCEEYYKELIASQKIEDMHIHPRPNCFSPEVLSNYIDICMKLGINRIGFVEHGRRVMKTRRGILENKEDLICYMQAIRTVKKRYSSIEIKSGIEIDYSEDSLFMQNMLWECSGNCKLDFVIGSVHGFGKRKYIEYINAVLDLVNNYEIDILGHFILKEEIVEYWLIVEEILKLLQEKDIALEFNKAERYNCKNIELKEMFLKKVFEYRVRWTSGSDAHSYKELVENNSRNWLS